MARHRKRWKHAAIVQKETAAAFQVGEAIMLRAVASYHAAKMAWPARLKAARRQIANARAPKRTVARDATRTSLSRTD